MSFEKIREALAGQLEISEDTITESTDILDDLGADSLDIVELMMFVEDEFGVVVPDEELHNFKTVGDVAAYVDAAMDK